VGEEVRDTSLHPSFALLLISIAASDDKPRADCSVSGSDLQTYLKQDVDTFDQSTKGWRKFYYTDQALSSDFDKIRCWLDTAQLIDVYHLHHLSGLKELDGIQLNWHAGEYFALAGLYDVALARMEQCKKRDEAADSKFRWNAYVDSTIAFLRRDLGKLRAKREELAAGTDPRRLVNLNVVDGLIKCFNQSYREARACPP
jgi:hypothetical protein